MSITAPLVDGFGRVHRNLRISVTDRCNIRCFYCMPDEQLQFLPRRELLSFEEITRFVRVMVQMGVDRIRITGGEPLVRADLPKLIRMLSRVEGLHDVALTTNGMLLPEHAQSLKDAGLQRVNISLDTLREDLFQQITRRSGVQRVLDGIFAAKQTGFAKLRLNAVTIRGLTESEIIPLGAFAREHDLELRFIEFMPLDGDDNWHNEHVLSGADVRAMLEAEFGPLTPLERSDVSQPAVDYRFADGRGRIGLINPVTEPFCGDCNRLRLLATGMVRNCLFSHVDFDVRSILRGGGSDEQLAARVRECIAAKKPGHGIDSPEFLKPPEAMYQIGG